MKRQPPPGSASEARFKMPGLEVLGRERARAKASLLWIFGEGSGGWDGYVGDVFDRGGSWDGMM